jgi:cytochrome d ubiquinol oxidase subunit I
LLPLSGSGKTAGKMSDLLAARLQMAISLGFHILFAVAGMAMPLLMVIAEYRHHRTGDAAYLDLARRWAKGTAILFAVGAVSGTVLSFELGLLWPTFMEHAGPLIGMPFSLEGFAFFLEAIGLGVYLYGWDKVPKGVHLASGVVVALSGLMSGIFVVAVNAFMNTPRGFRLEEGRFVDVDLWQAFFTPAFPTQAAHMAIAAYSSVGFAVLGIHAWRLLRDPQSTFHRAALRVALPIVIVSAPLQVLTGDFAAKQLAEYQPAKLAAAESLFETQRGAPLLIGGWPDVETKSVRGALHVPKLLSVLAKADPDAEVSGLDRVPRQDWPPIPIVHAAFQFMVGSGFLLLFVAIWGGVLLLMRKSPHTRKPFLIAATIVSPLGLLAVEAGWIVTEVGRQPWIIVGVMRVADAVTPMPALTVSLLSVCAIYALLGTVTAIMLRRHVLNVPSASPREARQPLTGPAA